MTRLQLTDDEVEAMRERLSSAALAIYLADGLEALTFRKLADAAGCSHMRPYRYFANKDALLARMRIDAFRRLQDFLIDRDDADAQPRRRLESLVLAYVEFSRRHAAEYRLMFSTQQPSPELYPDLLAARRSVFDHAVGALQAAIDAGVIHGDARRSAHLVWVSIHGLMSLHVANQLVHGYDLDALVQPLIALTLGRPDEAHGQSASAEAESGNRAGQSRVRPDSADLSVNGRGGMP